MASAFNLRQLSLVFMLLASGCNELLPATEIVVGIDTELELGVELDTLEVRVLDRDSLEDDEGPTRSYSLAATPKHGQHAMPFSFALVPGQDKRKEFRVVVTGLRARQAVVEQQAIVAFLPGKSQLLQLFLSRRCLTRLCRDDQGQRTVDACESESGDCREVEKSESLPEWMGDRTEIDNIRAGSSTVDAGTMDAAIMDDGGSSQSADTGSEDRDAGDTGMDVVLPDTGVDAGDAQTGQPEAGASPDAGCGACPLHASCQVQASALRCVCDATYVDDGSGGCVTPICSAMPCQNSGVCNAKGASRDCDCSQVDYQGTSCETKIDNCALTPCANGGACTDGVRTRSCICAAKSGFAGPSCADNVNECAAANVCAGSRNGVAFNYPCVDATGAAAGYGCTGQYPDWAPPPAGAGRFSVSGGVVTDSHTGLFWQQGMGPSTYTLAAARTYCAGLSLPGSGWRLPTRAELISIADYPKAAAPAIDTSTFLNTPITFVWTSSLSVSEPGLAWYVNFEFGNASTVSVSEQWYVRCVR